jgi:hypothetical protein
MPVSRRPLQPVSRSRSTALITIDEGPLKNAAWEVLRAARKRLTKATEELHRHEEKDEPAHRAWMLASCPTLISEIRELTMLYQSKRALIDEIESQAWRQHRSAAAVWQAYKKNGGFVDATTWDEETSEEEKDSGNLADDIINEMLRDQGIDLSSKEADELRTLGRERLGRSVKENSEPDTAKEIYRRIVQRLHPDRGGDWTPKRESLWHEVQRAWEARDADWLARLEAELEIAQETLTGNSPLSRLYAALKETEAARRDAERKVRYYKKSPAWRFTLKRHGREEVAVLASQLRRERDDLRAALAAAEATFAQWERPLGQARAKQKTDAPLRIARKQIAERK